MGTKKLIVCNLLSFFFKNTKIIVYLCECVNEVWILQKFESKKIISLFGSPCFMKCDDLKKKQSVL